MQNRAVIFVAWGDRYVSEVAACLASSSVFEHVDRYLITDHATDVAGLDATAIRVDFQHSGLARKVEMLDHLPSGYDSYLFLDSDTRVLDDLELGFTKAEQHGFALAQAPHYSLDHFWGFDQVMRAECVQTQGQLQYNTGVMFFALNNRTREVFTLWRTLVDRHWSVVSNDQPYLSLALELMGFVPYTLSISYNYRGFGEPISGVVRVWHSYGEVPPDLNDFDAPWPPRRAVPGRVLRSNSVGSAALEHLRFAWRRRGR